MIFIAKISKGHKSVKYVDGVMILILSTSSDAGLYSTKFHENILDGIKVIKRTLFSSEKFKRGIIP